MLFLESFKNSIFLFMLVCVFIFLFMCRPGTAGFQKTQVKIKSIRSEFTVETSYYKAVIDPQTAEPRSFQLKKYFHSVFHKNPVNVISQDNCFLKSN